MLRGLFKAKVGSLIPVGMMLVLAGGCAATAPDREIVLAEQAVDQAIDHHASDHAPLELKLARERLDRAKAEMADEDYDDARRLAEKAEADAKMATAKSDASTVQNVVIQETPAASVVTEHVIQPAPTTSTIIERKVYE